MWMTTTYASRRTFGGSHARHYSIAVDSDYPERVDATYMRIDSRSKYAKLLQSRLLGKQADGPIKNKLHGRTIVWDEEIITRSHVDEMIRNFYWITVCPSIAPIFSEVRQEYVADERAKALKDHSGEVRIQCRYKTSVNGETGGTLSISVAEARWLGEKLLTVARGELEGSVTFNVGRKRRAARKK